MSKYCFVFCAAFLAVAVSCERLDHEFPIGGRDESVAPQVPPRHSAVHDTVTGPKPNVSDEKPSGVTGDVTEHVVLKPVTGIRSVRDPMEKRKHASRIANAALGQKPAKLPAVATRVGEPKKEAPAPPLELQAIQLAAKELAANLRLKDEDDPAKRAELEREMVKLREQRQTLYQPVAEGK